MMDSKTAFEKWLTDGLDQNGLTAFILIQKRESGSYQLDHVNDKLAAWQASRAAIEIELPEEMEEVVGRDVIHGRVMANDMLHCCQKAITSQGLTIKK